MAATILSYEPEKICKGDTVKWKKTFSDYPASEGWELNYKLYNADGTDLTTLAFDSEVNDDGNDFQIVIPDDTTTNWTAQQIFFRGYVTKDSETFTVAQGSIEVVSVISSFNDLKHVRGVLDAIEATLLGRASESHESYSIQGRSITKMSPEELMRWRDVYKAELVSLKKAERIRKGLGSKSKIQVRFNR